MTKEQILKKALDEMPDAVIFTGYDFASACIKNGLNDLLNSESVIKNNRANYLKKHCKRISRKSYIKKNSVKKKEIKTEKEVKQEEIDFASATLNFEIDNAIALLKSQGYRIQKIITNYQEI